MDIMTHQSGTTQRSQVCRKYLVISLPSMTMG